MNNRYTIKDFEDSLDACRNRLILRHGSFVGIYAYNWEFRRLELIKPIINDPYGKREHFYPASECHYYEKINGVNSILPSCNEVHFIPRGYDLRKKSTLIALDSFLGRGYGTVEMIRDNNPKKKDDLPFISYEEWKEKGGGNG